MSKFARTLQHEFMELIPPTVYFFVVLHLVGVIRVLMTKGTGIDPSTSMSIAVAALIPGKVVLRAVLIVWYCMVNEIARVVGPATGCRPVPPLHSVSRTRSQVCSMC